MNKDSKMYKATINASQMVLQLNDLGFIEKEEIMLILDRILNELTLRDRIQVLCQVGDRQIVSTDDLMNNYHVDYESEKQFLIDAIEKKRSLNE